MDFISNTIDSQTGQRKGHRITGSQPGCKMSRGDRGPEIRVEEYRSFSSLLEIDGRISVFRPL